MATQLDPGTEHLLAALQDAIGPDRIARDALESVRALLVRGAAARAALAPQRGHDLRSSVSAVIGYADLLAEGLAASPDLSADAQKLKSAARELLAGIEAVPGWGPPPTPAAPVRPVVLVVDDDEDAFRIVRRHLRKLLECDVVWASNGAKAVEMARERRPSLITLDVCMPGVDGWDTLARLKSDPELGSVPVVMMSILQEQGRGILLGADEYLTKPLDRARLTEVVERFAPRGRGRVLVVDDTPSAREVARRLLEADGYSVDEAVDGADALRQMAIRAPDLVLLDLMMPEIDGFEVVARMSADPKLARIPTVILTALQLDAADRERLAHAVDAILPKGVPLASLLERVATSLRR